MALPIEADDPAVQAALGPRRDDVYSRIERARKMTPAQRKKAERDAARSKVTYDLPAPLIEKLERMAHDVYQVPPSHLAALLIMAGLQAVQQGSLDVYARRVPSRVPRFEWFLDLQEK
jgi:hypothetical protein